MKIVIEFVLIENLLINFIVFKTTAAFSGQKCRLALLSSFLGACLTVAIPAIGLTKVGNFLLIFGQNILFVCFSFKFSSLKNFLRIFACYYLSAFLYGGACWFFASLVGESALIFILLVVVVVFAVLKVLLREIKKKRKVEKFCCSVELKLGKQTVLVKGFLDSGNLLYDPVTKLPVSLINFQTFQKLCGEISLQDVMEKSKRVQKLKLAHYISIGSFDEENKILVFQADMMCVDGNENDKPILALSFKNFDALGSDMILHNSFAAV